MTIQMSDTFIHEGRAYPIWDFPLELYYEDHPRPAFGYGHSGLWRGYRATWEVEGETLYLTAIETEWPGRTGVGLAELFPGLGEKVEASWFSGKIHLYGVKERRTASHRKRDERDRILTFRSGRLIGSEPVDRRAPPETPLPSNDGHPRERS